MRNEYLMIDFAKCRYGITHLTDEQVADAEPSIIRINDGHFEECLASTVTIKDDITDVRLLWALVDATPAQLLPLIEQFKLGDRQPDQQPTEPEEKP